LRAFVLRLSALIVFALLAGQTLADDWNVVRARGTVLQLVDGDWQPLSRGSVVPDNRVVRTMGNGRATLARGKETIELAANTQIQIYDQGGRKPFTTIVEHFGTVAVEAEVRNVQHFAVKNQYLAAVVKGTRFTVSATRSGGAVEVQRGHVEVDSSTDHSTTLLAVGQRAKVQKTGAMTVSGKGKLPAVTKKGGGSAKPSGGKAPANTVAEAKVAVEDAVADLAEAKATGDVEAIAAAQVALEAAAEDAVVVAKTAIATDDKAGAKAATDAAKTAVNAADDAEKAAEKAAREQGKSDEEAAKAAAKAAEEARKAAEKAAKDQAKADDDAAKAAAEAAEDARKAAEKAAEEARKAAEKAAEEARKAAEKAAKDAEKAVEDAAKTDNSGKGKGKGKPN
jgi:hypothetical protein